MDEGNWQSWAAIGVVMVTLFAFVWRYRRQRTGASGCGHDCGCGSKLPEKPIDPPKR